MAQSATPAAATGSTSLAVNFGAAIPFGQTLAKGSGLFGVGFSRRLVGNLEAAVDVAALYDGRTDGSGGGEGTFTSSALLFHGGVRVPHSMRSMFVHYGGGLSRAHYASQVGIYRARCAQCLSRDGWGVYGSAGAGVYLKSRGGDVRPWIAVEFTADALAVSGSVGVTNPSDRRTTDHWGSVRGVFGFRFWPASRSPMQRQIAVPLNDLPWEVVADGARHKSMEIQGKRVRVLELTDAFVEHDWCTKGHVGYVLEGDLEIIRESAVEHVAQGNGFYLQAGANDDKHKARSIGEKVVLLLLEDV